MLSMLRTQRPEPDRILCGKGARFGHRPSVRTPKCLESLGYTRLGTSSRARMGVGTLVAAEKNVYKMIPPPPLLKPDDISRNPRLP